MKIKKTTTTISYHHRSFVLKSKRPKQKYSLSLSSPQQCERQKARRQKTRQKRGCKNQKKRERRERSIFFQPMESGRFCISLSLSLSLSLLLLPKRRRLKRIGFFHRTVRLSTRASLSLSLLAQTFLSSSRGEKNIFTGTKGERETREREKKNENKSTSVYLDANGLSSRGRRRSDGSSVERDQTRSG